MLLIGVVLFIAGVGAFVYSAWQQRERIRKSGIAEIDQMDGRTFERKLGLLFRDLGYSVRHTKVSGDYGADLVLHKNGTTTVVQAKRYSLDRKVGVSAVQEVVSAMSMYHAQHAIVITNTYFTAPAKTLARSNQVELWERTELINALTTVRKQQDPRPQNS
ncbi:MAG: restriction endonuclease [Thermaerobacter sp.]|nr:restriction endonuclease [Thermaerobacter sp.]